METTWAIEELDLEKVVEVANGVYFHEHVDLKYLTVVTNSGNLQWIQDVYNGEGGKLFDRLGVELMISYSSYSLEG